MDDAETGMPVSVKMALSRLAAALASVALAGGMMVLSAPRLAHATPQFATQTRLPCSQCHQSATGGPLTDFGQAFMANGNKVPAKN